MCLIIHQPKGHTLSHAHLLDIARKNGDGFGIMYAERGVLHTFRAVLDPQEMVREYLDRAAGRECVLHWRMATHGEVNEANAHPFRVGGVAVMHNGMVDIGCPRRGMSDTWHLVEYVIGPVARHEPDRLWSAEWQAVTAGLIGTGDRPAIMDATGRVALINRASGVEHLGRWYSNTYAWSAPAGLSKYSKPYSGRYGREYWDAEPWDAEDLVPATRAIQAGPSVPDVSELTEAEERELVDLAIQELADAVEREGEPGALTWLQDHPETAVHVLTNWYETTTADAVAAIEHHPAAVAEWLAEIVGAIA